MINFQQYSPRARNKDWFKVSAKIVDGKSTGSIEIFDYIDPFFGVSDKELISQINKFNADNVDQIVVSISSGGGDVFAGYNIYNALVSSKAPVKIIVTGLAASIASIIAMAGEEVYMHEAANFMIHNAWSLVAGNANDMMATAAVLQKLDTQLISIYAKKFNVDKLQIENLMAKETWFSAAEALEIGAVDVVIKSEEAKTIMASAFDLSIYKNTPKELLNKNIEDRLAIVKEEQQIENKNAQDGEIERQKMYQRRIDLALREAIV